MGCDFARKSCKELMDESESYPFCQDIMSSSSAKTTCTFDATAIGSCNLVQFGSTLPPLYQNFDTIEGIDPKEIGTVGGSVTLADFCPYIQEFTWKSQGTSRGTRCQDLDNQPSDENNYALEDYGIGSMCFEQAGPWQQRSCSMLKQWQRYGGGCYSSICEDGMLKILLENATLTCQKSGQIIDVALVKDEWLHEGSIVCPPCTQFCDDCSNSDEDSDEDFEDVNEALKQSVEDAICKAEPRVNMLLGFLQDLGFDPSGFSK